MLIRSPRHIIAPACTYQGRKSSVRLCISPSSRNGIDQYLDHEWKNAFFVQVLTPVLEAIVAVNLPNYPHIISLDKMVRDFEIPTILDEHYNHEVRPRFLVMQRALVSMGRDIGILILSPSQSHYR